MKRYLLTLLFAALSFAGLAGDGTNYDDCNINGTETMDAVVVLTATDNAPTGAAGVAKIESENEDGSETAHVDIKAFGLTPGSYDLSITLQSTGSNVDLGQFTAGSDGHDGGDGGQGEDQGGNHHGGGEGEDHMGEGGWISCNWGGCTNWGSWTNWNNTDFTCGGVWGNWFGNGGGGGNCTNGTTVTEIETDLPADVNPTDIAEIIVSDSNGNQILVGDLVTPSAGTVVNISGTVQVVPGPGAPGLSGTAQIQSTASKGKWKHHFTLIASGAAAKTTFKMNVNGHLKEAARSNKSGQMTVKKLPSHTPALRSLKLLDGQGNVAGSAQF